MVENSSHREYLDTYVDDILIWSKDPMVVLKSLEITTLSVKDFRHSMIYKVCHCYHI
jgi:hypothetical protein